MLAAVALPGLKGALSGDEMKFLNNPDSVQGQTLLGERMSGLSTSSGAMETILVHSDELTVDDPAFQQVVTQTAAAAAEKELVSAGLQLLPDPSFNRRRPKAWSPPTGTRRSSQ